MESSAASSSDPPKGSMTLAPDEECWSSWEKSTGKHLAVERARHAGLAPAWSHSRRSSQASDFAVSSSEAPGRRETGEHEGRGHLHWQRCSASVERQDSCSQWEQSVSVSAASACARPRQVTHSLCSSDSCPACTTFVVWQSESDVTEICSVRTENLLWTVTRSCRGETLSWRASFLCWDSSTWVAGFLFCVFRVQWGDDLHSEGERFRWNGIQWQLI